MTEITLNPGAPILLANLINGFGVLGLIYAHFLIARSSLTQGFLFSSSGAVLVAIGSALLGSWPVVFLNVAWFLIGIIGLFRAKNKESNAPKASSTINLLFVLVYIVGYLVFASLSHIGTHAFGAWAASGFYLTSFVLLSVGLVQSRHYLFICLLGYLLLVEHLILTQNYAVLANETVGALIGAWGILVYCWQKWRARALVKANF